MFENADFSWMDLEARWEAQLLTESHVAILLPSDAHRILLGNAIDLEQEARNQMIAKFQLGSDAVFRVLNRIPDWIFNSNLDMDQSQLFQYMNLRWNNRRIDVNHPMRYWAWHGWMRGLFEIYPYVVQAVNCGTLDALPPNWPSKVPRRSSRGRFDFRCTPDFVMEYGGRVLYIPGVGTIPTQNDFPMDWGGAVAGIRYRPDAKTALRLKVLLWGHPSDCDFRQAEYNDPIFGRMTDVVNYFNIRTVPPRLVHTGFGDLDPVLDDIFETANEAYWRKVIEFLTDALGADEAISVLQSARGGTTNGE